MHIQVKSPIDCSERSGDSTDELRTNSIGDGPRERGKVRKGLELDLVCRVVKLKVYMMLFGTM